jgi:hypothetical protein
MMSSGALHGIAFRGRMSLDRKFSRVEQIYFRMGPLNVGRKGRISLACVYI